MCIATVTDTLPVVFFIQYFENYISATIGNRKDIGTLACTQRGVAKKSSLKGRFDRCTARPFGCRIFRITKGSSLHIRKRFRH